MEMACVSSASYLFLNDALNITSFNFLITFIVHGVRIKNGKVNYVNHWVRTTKFKYENAKGQPEFLNIGDLKSPVGYLKMLVQTVKGISQKLCKLIRCVYTLF